MKYKVWVDDIRPIPAEFNIHFTTVDGFISWYEREQPEIELISLDHDAGDFASYGGDYIRILDYLEFKKVSIPISIHSGNIVGIKNMMRIIKKNNWILIPSENNIYLY